MTVFGDGPDATAPDATGGRGGAFNERNRKDLTAEAVIKPLAMNSPQNAGKITNVQLLGFKGKLTFTQDAGTETLRSCGHAENNRSVSEQDSVRPTPD